MFLSAGFIVNSAACVLADNPHAPVSVGESGQYVQRREWRVCCRVPAVPLKARLCVCVCRGGLDGGRLQMVAGCEIRLALTHGMRQRRCEVALGESAVQRSPPWELAAAMRRSRFTYVCRRLCLLRTSGERR